MRQSYIEIESRLWLCLEKHGFLPMEEFSAVDSLIHADEMLGVISYEGSDVVAEAMTYENGSYCMETDHRFCLHLYGKSGDFVDYEKHNEACCDLFYDIVSNDELLICKMEMSKAVQSMPLKRLERRLELTVRWSEKAEVE